MPLGRRLALLASASGARALSTMGAAKRVGSNACFGGVWQRFTHDSKATKTPMTYSVFVPPGATAAAPAPCLFYLSGLTCTDENFVQKAGAARAAAAHGVALVAPDTSPRGAGVPGEDDAYDFGSGAGFYVDATAAPWSEHYNMYSYVTDELVESLRGVPEVDVDTRSVTGHSMGGHGALTIAMKDPSAWKSVSAFSPICNPTKVPWGKKAFEGYLGSVEAGAAHDASELVRKGGPFAFGDILISQGADDDFLVGDVDQLQPEAFRAACDSVGQGLELRYEAGYDHSYFFIATFVDQHVNFHADRLLAR